MQPLKISRQDPTISLGILALVIEILKFQDSLSRLILSLSWYLARLSIKKILNNHGFLLNIVSNAFGNQFPLKIA